MVASSWSLHLFYHIDPFAKAIHSLIKGKRRVTTWRMPWQQCSIFSKGENAVINVGARAKQGAETALVYKAEGYDDTDDSKSVIHVNNLLTSSSLPKWNARDYVKAIQNAAYLAHSGTPVVETVFETVKKIVKQIALNVTRLNNYELTRVIFACSKGGLLQRGMVTQSFVTLMEDEVMQRMERLQTVDLFRVLHSMTHMNAEAAMYPAEPLYGRILERGMPFDEKVVRRIVNRMVERIAYLGVMDIANLVCLVAYNGMIDDKVVTGVNNAIKRRLWGIKDPITILTPLIAFGMFDALRRDTVEHSLNALRMSCGLPSYSSQSAEPTEGNDIKMDMHVVNNQLFPLKLMEMILRLDYEEIHGDMSIHNKAYLSRVRSTLPRLRRCHDWEYVPPMGSFKPMIQYEEALNTTEKLNLVPHIHGPYAIRQCDPLRKFIIERKAECSNSHTWQEYYIAKYYEMRSRHLINSGYKLISA
ncbi:hypothetical protein BgAZ_209550 [Babesia gibsoni]|uniref:Uncharacterized protein n=1 Tax=Babesia gibsoni TaxID=33632 RepID=A0AAD8PEZ5_BABGI|nr:hypothetical protein BgAZ_209550 [Babesia gibsoni]